ncbi:MAG: quinolinate synthase NadA [Planctomycetota bacterium]|nr:quinolinate synthase NadA [Planctomycetota bacterium]
MVTLVFPELLPPQLSRLTPEETDERIAAAKEALGSRLVILGHHYQRDEVIKFADFRGDSFKLCQEAAACPDAEYILFAGVHFMAESADILSGEHQQVILPDLSAGCSMADMANSEQVDDCWAQLTGVTDEIIIPITYMNSTAALKSFCGKNNGAVCTSSNAESMLNWAWEQGEKVLFFPDQHLGRNTAAKMGVPLDKMIVWDPHAEFGGVTEEQIREAKVILWKGHCSVHQRFTVEHIEKAREQFPGCRVIVHPECSYEVVQAADENGSTNYIINAIEASEPGTTWIVGTEMHLVNRLSKELENRTVHCLDDCMCMCATMYRIDPEHLLWALENLLEGRVVNRISVDDETRKWALVALDRMLAHA